MYKENLSLDEDRYVVRINFRFYYAPSRADKNLAFKRLYVIKYGLFENMAKKWT